MTDGTATSGLVREGRLAHPHLGSSPRPRPTARSCWLGRCTAPYPTRRPHQALRRVTGPHQRDVRTGAQPNARAIRRLLALGFSATIGRVNHLREVWSVLREPLTSALSFTQMKEVAGGAGMPVARLSHLRQSTPGGGMGASKGTLADALDGLFNDLTPEQQDRVTGHVVAELVSRSNDAGKERLDELLERAGWHLVGGEPAPLTLSAPPAAAPLPQTVQRAFGKAVRRFRDGDFDGAMTSIVGVVDTLTEDIYIASGLSDHKRASYHQRAVTDT